MKFISMCFLMLILVGCSESGMIENTGNEKITFNSKTEVYTVHSIDLLSRHVLDNGNGDRLYMYLSETNLTDQIYIGARIEITEYEYNQGGRHWVERKYKFLD